ncbi:Putative diacylglycerol O-acyltransferase (plasmid) [Rhodococcus opacus PD630]|nr:Putative diacylglycerol O-acyltransferase [Rhodococcus opacus PD630]
MFGWGGTCTRIHLERLRLVAKSADATINNMVLAMSAGALRTYLAERDALPATPLIALVQVSLRDSDRRNDGGNDVGVLMCNLGTHLSDPAARFDTVRACMCEGKQALSAMSGAQVLAMSTLGAGPDVASMLLGHNARVRPPFDLIISDVPGPRNPRYWNSADKTRCTRSRSPSMGKDSTSPAPATTTSSLVGSSAADAPFRTCTR